MREYFHVAALGGSTGRFNDGKNTIRSDQVYDDTKPNLRLAGALCYHCRSAQIEFA